MINHQSLSIGIFADLIGLQNLPSRGYMLGRLRMLMDKINATFRDTIRVEFMIITDTEFKAAVDRRFPLQDFLALYHEEFGKDVGTHLGVGLGVLGVPQEREPGGCFYEARGAMVQARVSGKFLVFQGFEMNEAINALFHFTHEMTEAMTERQRKIIEVYRKSGDIVSVASELYLPKQAVFDSIKAARYDIYSAAWRGLDELLRFDIQMPLLQAMTEGQQCQSPIVHLTQSQQQQQHRPPAQKLKKRSRPPTGPRSKKPRSNKALRGEKTR